MSVWGTEWDERKEIYWIISHFEIKYKYANFQIETGYIHFYASWDDAPHIEFKLSYSLCAVKLWFFLLSGMIGENGMFSGVRDWV